MSFHVCNMCNQSFDGGESGQQCPSCGEGVLVETGTPSPPKQSIYPFHPGDDTGVRVIWIAFAVLIMVFSVIGDITQGQNIMIDHPQYHTHLVFLWVLVMSVVGFVFGRLRAREWTGAALGLCLGPLGWLLTFVLADYRPRCPECRGVIQPEARRCPHCRAEYYDRD